MRDLYSDDHESVAVGGPDPLIPSSLRRLAGAAVFLGVIGAMGLWSYRLGTRDAAEVPIVKAMEGPTRVAPAEPGGLQAEHQGLEVNRVLSGQAPSARPVAATTSVPEVLTAEDAPKAELAAEVARLAESTEIRAPRPEEMPELAAAPTIQSELAAMVASAAPLDATAVVAPEVGQAVPGARPMGRPANLAPARQRPAVEKVARKTAAIAPAAATAATPVAAAREVKSLGPGSRLVQLGAYDSEELARKAWNQLVARQGDLLASKSLYVERATSNARVFYRLRVAGFQDTEQTRAMCEALRARGIDCIPVTLQ